jgi:hypothetical protein
MAHRGMNAAEMATELAGCLGDDAFKESAEREGGDMLAHMSALGLQAQPTKTSVPYPSYGGYPTAEASPIYTQPQPSLPAVINYLRTQLNLPLETTQATVIERACLDLEVETEGRTLLGKAMACWQMFGAPPLSAAPQAPVAWSSSQFVGADAVPPTPIATSVPPVAMAPVMPMAPMPSSTMPSSAMPSSAMPSSTMSNSTMEISAMRWDSQQLEGLLAAWSSELSEPIPEDANEAVDQPVANAVMPTFDEEETPSAHSETLSRPCTQCRHSRVLCNRAKPCGRCVRLGLECTVPPTVRRGRPKRQPEKTSDPLGTAADGKLDSTAMQVPVSLGAETPMLSPLTSGWGLPQPFVVNHLRASPEPSQSEAVPRSGPMSSLPAAVSIATPAMPLGYCFPTVPSAAMHSGPARVPSAVGSDADAGDNGQRRGGRRKYGAGRGRATIHDPSQLAALIESVREREPKQVVSERERTWHDDDEEAK